ncbi:MAG: 6-carboxytetrahydropterin synthase [Planctomycetes bacterium]|nr:6-carboxytetrahydropterin synthase [Planctomycetota bacterium]
MPEPALSYLASARFEAARSVACVADGHPCRRLHGHSFLCRLRARPPAAWVPYPGGALPTLAACLQRATAELDYRFLNELLAYPTDEELARWLWRRLTRQGVAERSVHGLLGVGIASTAEQGVELLALDRARVWRRFHFAAAHRLPRVPAGHPCGRLHGHSFAVTLIAEAGFPDQAPLALDYELLAEAWEPIGRQLAHRCLNEVPGLDNPTSEVLAAWLWERLRPALGALRALRVAETCTAGCHYDGQRHVIWKEFRAESAVRLPAAPNGSELARWHGHSYRLRCCLAPPFDAMLGWTIDFRAVKDGLQAAIAELDHHALNELPGIADGDPASVASWLWDAARARFGEGPLVALVVEEEPGHGAVLGDAVEPW